MKWVKLFHKKSFENYINSMWLCNKKLNNDYNKIVVTKFSFNTFHQRFYRNTPQMFALINDLNDMSYEFMTTKTIYYFGVGI